MGEIITPEEAAEALRLIEASRAAFRSAIRTYRGYQHLWLWGGVWIAQCLYLQLATVRSGWLVNSLTAAGVTGSLLIGRHQAHLRQAIDRRFLAALGTIVGFAVVAWPLVLSGHRPLPPGPNEMIFAYCALVAMQCYVLTGIWFDNHLLWVGLLVSVVIILGYLFFLAWFWWWMAIFAGGTLVASGFYIHQRWK